MPTADIKAIFLLMLYSHGDLTAFFTVQMFHIHFKLFNFHLNKHLCWFLGLIARITIRSDEYNYQSAFRLKIHTVVTRSKN